MLQDLGRYSSAVRGRGVRASDCSAGAGAGAYLTEWAWMPVWSQFFLMSALRMGYEDADAAWRDRDDEEEAALALRAGWTESKGIRS